MDDVLRNFDLERKDLDFKCPRNIRDRIADEIIPDHFRIGRSLNVSDTNLKSVRHNNSLTLPEDQADEHGNEATCLKLAEALFSRKKKSVLEILCREVNRYLEMKRDSTRSGPSTRAAVSHRSSNSQRHDETAQRQEDEPKFNEEDLVKIIERRSPISATDDLRNSLESFLSEVVVLLHTVKEEEMLAALDYLRPPLDQSDKAIKWVDDRFSLTLGFFGGHKAALIQTRKGVDCQHEILPALQYLPNVKLIIGLGFGYGLKSKCDLGDVLVSTYVDGVGNIRFEHDRLKFDESLVRHTNISIATSNVFAKATSLWRSFTCSKSGRLTKVVSGLLISSPALLNDKRILEEYLNNNHRLIGGEMEGQELAHAQLSLKESDHREVDFVVIKGVADFGDGTKEKGWQLTASLAAASYAEHKLQESAGRVYYCSRAEAATRYVRVVKAQGSSRRSFFLNIVNGKIKKCNGCKKNFRCKRKALASPDNLIVGHLENISFQNKSGAMRTTRGNVYYHLDFNCIKVVNPDIDQSEFVISASDRSKLTDAHKEKLKTLGMEIK